MVSAGDSVAAFLNAAVNRAERHQQPVELVVSRKDATLALYSNEPGFARELKMPDGVSIEAVLPAEEGIDPTLPRRILFLPGATVPGIGIQLSNRRNAHRLVRLDPMTGFPRVESVIRTMRGNRGFTLLEMIVATTIMGIAVAGLMCGISSSTRNAARLRDYDRVVQLARLRMNEPAGRSARAAQCAAGRRLRPGAHRRPGMRLARTGQRGRKILAHTRARTSSCSTAYRSSLVDVRRPAPDLPARRLPPADPRQEDFVNGVMR